MSAKYKCTECGSTNIQSRAWVDLNTMIFIEWVDDEEYWCQDCQEFVEIEDKENE